MANTNTGSLLKVFKEFISRCELREFSPKTVQLYHSDLARFISFLESDGIVDFIAITPISIEAFLGSAKTRGCKPHSIERLRRNIKTFLSDVASRYDLIPINFKKVIRPRLPVLSPKAIDAADLRMVMEACDEETAFFLRFLYDSALRLTEAISLKIKNIDLKSGLVVIERGKGGKARSLIISDKTLVALHKHVKALPPHAEYIFISRRTNLPFTRSGMQTRIRRLSAKTGIKISPHRLRHSSARAMLISGADIHTLQARLGHSSPEMSLQYSRLFSAEALERGKQFSAGANL